MSGPRPFRFGVNGTTTSLQVWQEVARTAEGRKVVHHPVAGTLVFEHAVFSPQSDMEQRMILYTPLPEQDTPAKLARLLD